MASSAQMSCLVCRGTQWFSEPLCQRCRRDNNEPAKFAVRRCRTCGHTQILPIPQPTDFFRSDREDNEAWGASLVETWRAKAAADDRRRLEMLRARVPAVRSGAQRPRLLDVGSGYGFFVDLCNTSGTFDAAGIELSEVRYRVAVEHMRGTFTLGGLDDAWITEHAGTFDVVTASHVLNCLAVPVTSFVRQCMRLLRPGGVFFAEVPNRDNELVVSCESYKAFAWDICQTSYFDRAHLVHVIERAGVRAADVDVLGVQRYGLRNFLNWIDTGRPQMETPVFDEAVDSPLRRAETLYKQDKVDRWVCDTLCVIATRTSDHDVDDEA